jgi:adenosylhomocysteine nucleosidase
MIGIIGAMPEELERVLFYMEEPEVIEHAARTFYQGRIHQHDVVVVLAGIGKVNAAITTTLLIEHFDVDLVVNIGVAGGQKGSNHLDIVIGRSVLYHDVDVTYFGNYLPGQMPGHDAEFFADQDLVEQSAVILEKLDYPYHIGRIASGDQFVYTSDFLQPVNDIYDDIYAVEMEACAIAHTASVYDVPFLIFRSISDVLDDDSQSEDFQEFLVKASEQVSDLLLALLDDIA